MDFKRTRLAARSIGSVLWLAFRPIRGAFATGSVLLGYGIYGYWAYAQKHRWGHLSGRTMLVVTLSLALGLVVIAAARIQYTQIAHRLDVSVAVLDPVYIPNEWYLRLSVSNNSTTAGSFYAQVTNVDGDLESSTATPPWWLMWLHSHDREQVIPAGSKGTLELALVPVSTTDADPGYGGRWQRGFSMQYHLPGARPAHHVQIKDVTEPADLEGKQINATVQVWHADAGAPVATVTVGLWLYVDGLAVKPSMKAI